MSAATEIIYLEDAIARMETALIQAVDREEKAEAQLNTFRDQQQKSKSRLKQLRANKAFLKKNAAVISLDDYQGIVHHIQQLERKLEALDQKIPDMAAFLKRISEEIRDAERSLEGLKKTLGTYRKVIPFRHVK